MVRRKAKKKQEQDNFIIGDNPKHRNHMFKMQANKTTRQQKTAYGTWGSQVIPHPSTNQAYGRLSSEFEMGSPACATSMAVYTWKWTESIEAK